MNYFSDLSLNHHVNLSENILADTNIVLNSGAIRFTCRFPRMLVSSSTFDVSLDPDGKVFEILIGLHAGPLRSVDRLVLISCYLNRTITSENRVKNISKQ